MPEVKIRKRLVTVEEIFHEGGPQVAVPHRRGAILVAIENPFAGRYVEEITPFMDDLTPLGVAMAGDLLKALAMVVLGLLIPVVVVAGLVAFVTLWWKMRQARRYGRPAFVVMRR